MKASEVLRRYKAGERDFRGVNLRGQSFKGQDLSAADFSGADIRGANFKNSTLINTNLTSVKAGIQKRWLIFQTTLSFLISVVLAFTSVTIVGTSVFGFLPKVGTEPILSPANLVIAFLFVTVLIVIVLYGLTAKTIGITAIIIGCTILISMTSIVVANTKILPPSASLATSFIIASAVSGGVIVAIPVTTVIAVSVVISSGMSGGIVVASIGVLGMLVGAYLAVTSNVYYTIAVNAGGKFAMSVAGGITADSSYLAALPIIILLFYGSLITWRTIRQDQGFSSIHSLGITFSCLGGTTFQNSVLHKTIFSKALLNNTSFRGAKLFQTDFYHSQNLNRASFSRNCCLFYPSVCRLAVTKNGYRQVFDSHWLWEIDLRRANLVESSLARTDFRGAMLQSADLSGANLLLADLSSANLRNANMSKAFLKQAHLEGADLTKAHLTGACLEAWNIDSQTVLDQVDCQYVYLLCNYQERRPSSGKFAPGEFTKLFQEVLSTVDLIFRNGVDWKAFVTAFQQVQVQNDDTQLEVQSIENKGDGVVVVRVSTSPNANKEKIHSEFNQLYELALQALEAQYREKLQAKESEIAIYREQNANLWVMINSQTKPTIIVQAIAQAKAMNDSTDQSQNFNVGGNFNINATNSVVNLRDISGNVTNTINQLPDQSDSDQPNFKELLGQLKAAIESDRLLPDTDKADLLEQVGHLAEAKQTEESAKKEGMVRKAKKMFDATLQSLPATAQIVEASAKLLPLIFKVLGLPV